MTTEERQEIERAESSFKKAYREWREGRPEFAKLVAAIKADASPERLQLWMAAAGMDIADVNELRVCRVNAKAAAGRAAAHRNNVKEAAAAEKEWVRLNREYDTAATPAARDAAEEALGRMVEPYRLLRQLRDESAVAVAAVDAGTVLGVY